MNANLTTAPVTAETAQTEAEELTSGKHACNCSEGCTGLTWQVFSQGHDARLVTRLRNAVLAEKMTSAEAFAEVTKRGGTDRLQYKLDAAIANAAKKAATPKKSRKGGKKAKVQTFELDGFTLHASPQSTKPVVAKVGRWEYEGTVRTHRSGETGATKEDTFMVFEFVNKAGELVETTKYKFVRELPVAEVAEVPQEDEAPILVSLRGDASAEAAREEVAELPINAFANRVATPAVPERAFAIAASAENTDDIPF